MRFRAKLLDITCITQLSSKIHTCRILHLLSLIPSSLPSLPPCLADIVATLARSVKTCVLRLSPTKVCFILSDRVPVGGANLWCEILQQNLFDEYRIEGKDERNEIYLEVVMEQLSRALKSALNATVVKLKLTKKQGACFTVEITQVATFSPHLPSLPPHIYMTIPHTYIQPTLTGALRGVTHDVPVTVVPVRLWADYQEPSMPDIDVSIL